MRFATFAAVAWTVLGMGPAVAQEAGQDPLDSGIVEQAERRMMQIDVTVRGPAAAVSALTPGDFKLAVGREDIDAFVLDRVCIDGAPEDLNLADPKIAASPPRLRTLLYFDQTHLTSLGRRRSLELARELIPEILKSGRSEAMIVSASRRLEVVSDWSADPAVLLAALEGLAADPAQVSNWADQEDARVGRMMAAIDRATEFNQEQIRDYNRQERMSLQSSLGGGGSKRDARINQRQTQQREDDTAAAQDSARVIARAVARDLSREEASRTAGSLSLFSMALRHLENQAPPKAVVYFADTMRSNAGDFYIQLTRAFDRAGTAGGAGRLAGNRPDTLATISAGNYLTEFQQVIDRANESGVRLYTVQGRGLTPYSDVRTRMGSAAISTASATAGKARFRDAENALSGFARETGGKSFLGAADAGQIAARLLDDLSCLFVFSFRALQLEEDRRTPVWIEVEQPGIELGYRPSLIASSDEVRDKRRLLTAFWAAGTSRDSARVSALPTGFENGKYTVLIQFAIPGSALSGSDWDMGLTAIVGQSKTLEASGRVATNQPGLPLVFEAEMRFKPGDYAIAAVAKNNRDGTLISTKTEGSLPDPDDREPFVASIAMLQRTSGAFVRGDAIRTEGSLAHGPAHWLQPDRATGIVALVCANKRADAIVAGRRLAGVEEVDFDPVELDFDRERCGLLIDTIDDNVLTSGRFTYAVDLSRGDGTGAATLRDFLVVSPDEIALAGN